MRKIHEAYDRLKNPWYRRPKVLLVLAFVTLVLGTSTFFALRLISDKNRAQTLSVIDQAFEEGDLPKVNRTLRLALAGEPEDEALQVQYARLLSRVQPAAALGVWKEVVKQSQDPEHAVAYTLTAINVRDYERAEWALDSILNIPGAESAYHRAGYALRFAQGRDPEALRHLEALLAIEPDSSLYAFEKSRLAARSQDASIAEPARKALWSLVEDSDVATRDQALKTLAQAYVATEGEAGLKRVLSQVRDPDYGLLPKNLMWALEAEDRLTGIQDNALIKQVWDLSLAVGDQVTWLQLLAWMNEHGYPDLALGWATERPSVSVWNFPSGMLLADSAFRVGAEKSISPALQKADWGGRDFLRFLIISRIEEFGKTRRFWLDQAYEAADRITRGGARLLLPVLDAWGWLNAESEVTARLLADVPIRPADIAGLLRKLEADDAWSELYRVSKALANAFPENHALKNNAAYLAALLGRDLVAAENWIREIMETHAEVPEFRSTAAFVFAVRGYLPEAASILEDLGEPFGLLARLLVTSSEKPDRDSVLSDAQKAALSSLELRWLENRDFI